MNSKPETVPAAVEWRNLIQLIESLPAGESRHALERQLDRLVGKALGLEVKRFAIADSYMLIDRNGHPVQPGEAIDVDLGTGTQPMKKIDTRPTEADAWEQDCPCFSTSMDTLLTHFNAGLWQLTRRDDEYELDILTLAKPGGWHSSPSLAFCAAILAWSEYHG